MCVFVCSHVYGHVCGYVWRPSDDDGCLPQLLSTLVSEIGSLPEPGDHWHHQISWPVSSTSTCICLPSPRDYRYMLPCMVFILLCVLESTSGLCACEQALCHPSSSLVIIPGVKFILSKVFTVPVAWSSPGLTSSPLCWGHSEERHRHKAGSCLTL